MPSIREQSVQLHCEGVAAATGSLSVLEYSPRDRLRRAILACLASWGLAALSVPIILAHWVLVPGFLIAGPVIAYRFYHIHAVPKKVEAQCPLCHQQVTIPMEASDQLPLWTYCPSCNQSVRLLELP